MSLQKSPDLQAFFSSYISANDADADLKSTQSFMAASSPDKQNAVIAQAKDFLNSASIVEVLGMEANRWFGDAAEAREWLESIIAELGKSESQGDVVVKDSNGTVLNDGDAVTVIKDLKVKGGSSDLKRGDLIKKIRLIGDPENIECNVNGSTLVLKTMFLKKA
jgi:protein PhnA